MVEHERYPSLPALLEYGVGQATLVGAVVPIGQVVGAVGALRGRLSLDTVHATLAFESGIREAYFTIGQ